MRGKKTVISDKDRNKKQTSGNMALGKTSLKREDCVAKDVGGTECWIAMERISGG